MWWQCLSDRQSDDPQITVLALEERARQEPALGSMLDVGDVHNLHARGS
jgi:hypothetical protein